MTVAGEVWLLTRFSDHYLYLFRSIFQDIVSMDTVIMKIMVS